MTNTPINLQPKNRKSGGTPMTPVVTIDPAKIPPLERRLLGKSFYEAMERFYENPANVRRYEAWQKGRTQEASI